MTDLYIMVCSAGELALCLNLSFLMLVKLTVVLVH